LIPIAVLAQNQPPVADAGPDKVAYTGDLVLLSGSAHDPDGDPIVYWLWTAEQAPANAVFSLENATTRDAYLTAFTPGDYVLSLTVGDPMDFSAPDFVTIHVADNLPPVAVATADKTTITVGGTVCFDGSQSYDPEGAPLSYIWNFPDGTGGVFGVVAPCHTFTSRGAFNVGLQVTDERGAYDFDFVVVTVLPPANHPPVASPTASPNTGDAPLTVQFAANASDPDNDPLTYAWDFGDPTSPDNTSTTADPIHEYQTPGTYVVSLTVSDGQLSASYSLTITVSAEVTLSIRYAAVKFWNRQKTMGDVRLWADFDAPMPTADDEIAVTFDKITLFSVPFSKFKPGLMTGVYWYVKNGYIVRINFANGQIFVNTPKIELTDLDNSNGVDVELFLGDGIAVENIMMTPRLGNRLVYRRSDTNDDPM
jgi:PKD repeat protein